MDRGGSGLPEQGRTYERLGQLYEERGDLESAARYHNRLTTLWEGADELLQPRVRQARSRLDELCRNMTCDDLLEPSAPVTGSLTVSIGETGQDLDLNGYVVRIDLSEDSSPLWLGDPLTQKVAGGGNATFSGLTPGSHTAHLIDLWPNCAVDGPDAQAFNVQAGRTSEIAFQVDCAAEEPASVDASGSWAGRYETVLPGVAGDVFFELEQAGDDIVGSFRLEFDEEGEPPVSGEFSGRVSGNLLALFSDYPGELNHNPGRLHFSLEDDGSEVRGTWSWDGVESFGTITLTRQ